MVGKEEELEEKERAAERSGMTLQPAQHAAKPPSPNGLRHRKRPETQSLLARAGRAQSVARGQALLLTVLHLERKRPMACLPQ